MENRWLKSKKSAIDQIDIEGWREIQFLEKIIMY